MRAGMSPAAIKAVLAPESGDDFIILITIYDPDIPSAVIARICDNWTGRLSGSINIGSASTGGVITYTTDDDDILYGVQRADGTKFLFLPIEITLPDERDGTPPRANIVFHDITQYLVPMIRSLRSPPLVKMEIVLSSNVDTPEVTFTDFYIYNITYNRDTISAELGMINYELEPFPQHSFTPAYFPGIF